MRNGQDYWYPDGGHTLQVVYGEMLVQIAYDYPSLPDPNTLTLGQILFWYNGIRADLKKHTKGN